MVSARVGSVTSRAEAGFMASIIEVGGRPPHRPDMGMRWKITTKISGDVG
jgi:hypothetical protein